MSMPRWLRARIQTITLDGGGRRDVRLLWAYVPPAHFYASLSCTYMLINIDRWCWCLWQYSLEWIRPYRRTLQPWQKGDMRPCARSHWHHLRRRGWEAEAKRDNVKIKHLFSKLARKARRLQNRISPFHSYVLHLACLCAFSMTPTLLTAFTRSCAWT